jgi:hypothetical protein
MAFFQRLERNLRYGPGVEALAISDSLPPGGYHRDQVYASLRVEGRAAPITGTGGTVDSRRVTPEYFRALQIPIVEGQGFTDEELTSSNPFVVLSKSLAERLFPGQDPLGQHLHLHNGAPAADDPLCTIAGVAADVKNGGLASGEEPEYYQLRRQKAQDWDRSSASEDQSAARDCRSMGPNASGIARPDGSSRHQDSLRKSRQDGGPASL